MYETDVTEPASLETSMEAYDIVHIYTELYREIRYETVLPDDIDERVIQALIRQFGHDIRSVFAHAPEAELLPAVGQVFSNLFLLWIRHDSEGGIPFSHQEKLERARPPRRRRSRRKSTSKPNGDGLSPNPAHPDRHPRS